MLKALSRSVCRASSLNLLWLQQILGFPQLRACSFLLSLREGARMELQTPGPSSLGFLVLREYQPIVFSSVSRLPIPLLQKCQKLTLCDISQCVNLESEVFVCF